MTSTVSVHASQRCTDRHRLGPNRDCSTMGPPHRGQSGVRVPICTATVNLSFSASLPRSLRRSGDHAGEYNQLTDTSSTPSTAKTAVSTSAAIIASAGHPENVGIRPMPTMPLRTSTCSSRPRSTIETPGYSGSSTLSIALRTSASDPRKPPWVTANAARSSELRSPLAGGVSVVRIQTSGGAVSAMFVPSIADT